MTLQAQGCFKLHQTLLQYGEAPTDPLPTSPEHPGPSVSGEAPAQALLPSGCAEPCRTPRGRCPPRRSLAPGHARTASAGDLRGRRDRAGDAGRAAGSPPRPAPTPHPPRTTHPRGRGLPSPRWWRSAARGRVLRPHIPEAEPPRGRRRAAPHQPAALAFSEPPHSLRHGDPRGTPDSSIARPAPRPGLSRCRAAPLPPATPQAVPPHRPRRPSSTHRLVPSRLPPPRRPMARRHLA